MQKYPRGSRGSPAKGVVWENRSTSSNLVFCAKKRTGCCLSVFSWNDGWELVNYHEFAREASLKKFFQNETLGERRSFDVSSICRLLRQKTDRLLPVRFFVEWRMRTRELSRVRARSELEKVFSKRNTRRATKLWRFVNISSSAPKNGQVVACPFFREINIATA